MVAYMMCVKDRVRNVAWEDTRNEIATYIKWDTLELLGYIWRFFVDSFVCFIFIIAYTYNYIFI
jgi:hypothetical protein